MTRVSYVEDEDYPGQFNLWHANVARSLAGRRGQAALRELEVSLLALPTKRLVARHLIKDGEVCAIGSLALHHRVAAGEAPDMALVALAEEFAPACDCFHAKHPEHDAGPCARCTTLVAEQVGQPEYARWAKPCAGYHSGGYVDPNEPDEEDEEGLTEEVGVAHGMPRLVAWKTTILNDVDLADVTPEERYTRVLAWVQRRLAKPIAGLTFAPASRPTPSGPA